jgi:hypothetical protein
LDLYVPKWIKTPNQGGHVLPSEYESGMIASLHGHVEEGDQVTVIGGGLGVTAVVAARHVGEGGGVTVFEGSETMVDHIYDTLELNGVADRVDVKHAVVADDLYLEGDAGDAEVIPPTALPSCDVLEMDCEGAEMLILHKLDIQPREMLVETHWNLESVKSQIEDLDYSIVSETLAETGPYEQMCRENDIKVLVAQ